ncbi:hypothetical protein BLA29_001889, partial [Euroglyphus maynei]
AARVGKFSKIGEKGVKYFLRIGEKILDLAELGRSIKTAVDTGEPLAIYQAFLASGMSVKDAYDTAKNMSSELKLGEMASLEKLEAIHNNTPESSLSSTMQARTFRVGSTEMIGRINNGEIEIFNENTRTWGKGSKLHLLAYRLQNAGGGRRLPVLFSNKIVIGEHTFKRVKYSQDKFNEMMRIAKTYTLTSNSTERIAKLQQDYSAGKEMSHAPQYDHYNSLSLDDKLDLFNKPNTDAITRGVLAGKINESIVNINSYEAAKAADDWKVSANKATDVVLAPQSIFLKGRAGECLPESVLMGWALQSGQDKKLAKELMGIYSSPNIADNPLYKSLVELHADGNASKFSAGALSDVKVSALGDAESRLFPRKNSSVRVDIPGHTMLLSKVNQEGKVKYVFYDPNYGLAYFDKYKDMSDFFKKKLEAYNTPEGSTNFYNLDYSRLPEVKIEGKSLNEIIIGAKQPDTGSKQTNGTERNMESRTHGNVEAQNPNAREPIIETSAHHDLTTDERNLCNNTYEAIKGYTGSEFKDKYIAEPKANCANAAEKMYEALRYLGYTDVKVVELGIWNYAARNDVPSNHYVVMAKKDGIEIVVDVTAGQFSKYGFLGPIVTTKNDWIYQWQQGIADYPRVLVKMAPFNGGISNSPFNLNSPFVDAKKTVPGGVLLQSPDWYGKLPSAAVQLSSAPTSSIAREGNAHQPHTNSIQIGDTSKVNLFFRRPSNTETTEPVKEEQQQSAPKLVQYSYRTQAGQSYYDVMRNYKAQNRYADTQKFYLLNKHNIPKNMTDAENQPLPEGTVFEIPPLLPQPKTAEDDYE